LAFSETKDSKTLQEGAEVSQEMLTRKRTFSHNHAMSIHLNLVTVLATAFYGWRLGSKLSL
jgi:hypothetical protein